MKSGRLLAVLGAAAVVLAGTVATAAAERVPAKDSIAVKRIDFQNDAFVRGMDISSVISLEEAGVTFKDEAGKKADIFALLAENGVNTIRVRVWNRPYDNSGRGYGGGNSDLEKAKAIGKRAAAYGMKLLVDFHYSDFWADPAKQQAPKAWSGLSVSRKCERLYAETLSSLKELREAGADIGMVQIGNEINAGLAGVFDGAKKAALLNAGAAAVRAFDRKAAVVCHFTNPEKTATMKWFADYLNENQVDYDVFAVSYYPCWHGSLANLTEVLNYAAVKYGKNVMVAETSYPYTLADTDGHANTISQWNNSTGGDMLWAFSPQGQADEVRAVMDAVNRVSNGRGLGVCYWEGAWITVGDITGKSGSAYDARWHSNFQLWEQCGCGWASSASAEYDPDDAGRYYGGSAVDNQAFFDAQGRMLPSLHVFRNVQTGAVSEPVLTGDVNGDGAVTIEDVTETRRFLAELTDLSDEHRLAADTVRDGVLTAADATEVQRYLAEYTTDGTIGTWY